MISKIINTIIDNDIGYSFMKSKIAIISTIVFLIILFCSAFAELVAPYNPFDPASISLLDAFIPPVWTDGGDPNFLLGTDQQGRDMLSTMIYGSRISLIVGFASILFAMFLGTFLAQTQILRSLSLREFAPKLLPDLGWCPRIRRPLGSAF